MDIDDIAALISADDNGLLPRAASQMSMASSPMMADRVSIVVYNHITNTEAVIMYPDVTEGWIFRSDVSTTTTLRWEYNNTLAVVTRHATCDNAVIPRQRTCRNCEMKRTWRKQCSEKCETFFLVALENATNVETAMAAVIKQERPLSNFALSRLVRNVPFNASARKVVSSEWDVSTVRAIETEKKFRQRLIKSGQAVVQCQPQLSTTDLLIELAYPELSGLPSSPDERSSVESNVVDDFAAIVNVTSSPPPGAIVVTPSRHMVIVSPRRDPTSPVVLATTVATADLVTVTEAYTTLIDKLSPGKFSWTLNDWHAIADGRNFSSSFVRLNQCSAFERLVHRMGCNSSWSQIILHPSMSAFMQTLRRVIHADGSVTVGVGVYRAPTVEAYDAFCSADFAGQILVNPVYVSSTVDPDGVRPVVVMYQPPAGVLDVSKVVPIGAFGV